MAGSGLYKNIVRADATQQEPGYQKAWLNILTDFTTLVEPVGPFSASGDNLKIATAHTWKTGKGAIALYVNNKLLEAPAETVGDSGSRKMKYTLKFFIKGDGAAIQDFAMNILNEDIIAFVQDGCGVSQYFQFGCDCSAGEVVKGSFASGRLQDGSKGWSFEVEFLCRYFYNAALTIRT